MAMYPIPYPIHTYVQDPLFHHGKLKKNFSKDFINFFLCDLGFEPRFGVGLSPSDFHTDRIVPREGNHHHLPTGYRRPWAIAHHYNHDNSGKKKNLHFGKDGFQAFVDVHHFQPSEIMVKTVDQTVIVVGKHKERDDGHGSVQRHFSRKYTLPLEYDMTAIHSALSSDGVLTVKAPPPQAIANGERHIPITHTNLPVHFSIMENKPSEDKK